MLILAALFTVKAVIKSNNNKGLLQVEAINGYIACLKMTPTNGYWSPAQHIWKRCNQFKTLRADSEWNNAIKQKVDIDLLIWTWKALTRSLKSVKVQIVSVNVGVTSYQQNTRLKTYSVSNMYHPILPSLIKSNNFLNWRKDRNTAREREGVFEAVSVFVFDIQGISRILSVRNESTWARTACQQALKAWTVVVA